MYSMLFCSEQLIKRYDIEVIAHEDQYHAVFSQDTVSSQENWSTYYRLNIVDSERIAMMVLADAPVTYRDDDFNGRNEKKFLAQFGKPVQGFFYEDSKKRYRQQD